MSSSKFYFRITPLRLLNTLGHVSGSTQGYFRHLSYCIYPRIPLPQSINRFITPPDNYKRELGNKGIYFILWHELLPSKLSSITPATHSKDNPASTRQVRLIQHQEIYDCTPIVTPMLYAQAMYKRPRIPQHWLQGRIARTHDSLPDYIASDLSSWREVPRTRK
jgi:hypothetical protein